MKKGFVIRALAVVVAFVAADILFGITMGFVRERSKGGDTLNVNYINQHFNDSVAIFGSSRANHHYVSSLLEDSLDCSVYNCGIDGNGILLAYCFLNNIIATGHTPQLIIYDFFPKFDLYDNNDYGKALTQIRPYYDIEGMKDIINDLDDREYLKLNLSTYRYNSRFIQMLSDAVAPKQLVIKGYKPMYGEMSRDFVKDAKQISMVIDSLKVKYLQKFVGLCRQHDIELVFVTSPTYFGTDVDTDYTQLLRHYGGEEIELIDMGGDSRFVGRNELFVDPSHMNDTGARLFTSLLADTIRAVSGRLPYGTSQKVE